MYKKAERGRRLGSILCCGHIVFHPKHFQSYTFQYTLLLLSSNRRSRVPGSIPLLIPHSQSLYVLYALLLIAQLTPHYSLLSFSYGTCPLFYRCNHESFLIFWTLGRTQHRILVPHPQSSFITLKTPQGCAPSQGAEQAGGMFAASCPPLLWEY